jgi:hypothetical protein
MGRKFHADDEKPKNLEFETFPFLEKLNFASFQNGGFAQNGHKNLVF